MFQALRSNLGRRIVFLVAMSTLLVLISLGVSGWLAVRQSSEQVFHERQALAQTTGTYLDYILRQNLERLDNITFAPGVDIEDTDLEPEKRALHSTYLGSIFNDGVFITDQRAIVLWVEPFRQGFVGTSLASYAPVQETTATTKPSISNILTVKPGNKAVIFMVTPLRNRDGEIVGLAGGQIDPKERSLPILSQPTELGETSYIDIIDSNGVILDSSDPGRILNNSPGGAEQTTPVVTESAYLATAPWSVVIGQSEKEAMAPVHAMQQRFIIFGASAVVIALFLSWGMARSLVKPIRQLTAAAENISQGNLSQPVPQLGSDEIGKLSRSFDTMRVALQDSLLQIQTWNKELETKVEERTRQLEESYREIARKGAAHEELLRKVLTIQEEERKRIARELHDETSQSLVSLVMRVEAIKAIPAGANDKLQAMLLDMKNLTVKTIDNVHKIIFDLRPSILDDLGLLSAIRWYTGNRLEPLGIQARVEVTGEERKLSPPAEIALFRVVQEAINNIVKHAEAHSVVLSVEFKESTIMIEVEDDGKGFDEGAVSLIPDKAQGVGLLGMKERIALLGGEFRIVSGPGKGTHLTVEVPL